jgi:hypothetical protein
MPRKSGNPQEVTAGVGVGLGVGVGGGVKSDPAASPPPESKNHAHSERQTDPDPISQSDITPTGANVNTNDTSPEPVAETEEPQHDEHGYGPCLECGRHSRSTICQPCRTVVVSIDGYAETHEDHPESTNGQSGLPVPISDELFTQRDLPVPLADPDKLMDPTGEWLIPMLLKIGGTRATISTWLTAEYELIVNEVVALGLPTRQRNHAKVKTFAHRYWRQQLKNPSGKKPHQSWAERDSYEIKRKLGIADD